jgi:hypothetical protein
VTGLVCGHAALVFGVDYRSKILFVGILEAAREQFTSYLTEACPGVNMATKDEEAWIGS